MAKGISGWTTKDLHLFLKSHNFSFFKESNGSHEAWISVDEKFIVDVNITHGTYPERTMETMIINSGLDKNHWKRWTKLGARDKKKAGCCKK